MSLPSIIIEGIFGGNNEDLEYIEKYQDIITVLDRENEDWILKKEEEYAWCDSIRTHYNYALTWYEFVSIDAVRYAQDFSGITEEDILNLARKFMQRNAKTETYTVIITTTDSDGNATPKTETRTRAIITVDTLPFNVETLASIGITEKEDILLVEHIYDTLLAMDIEGELCMYDNVIDPANLIEYDEGTADIPYYNQTDARWALKSYGRSTILSGGCGPTALAMVISGLTTERVTPDMVAAWSVLNGYRAEGSGSYWGLMAAGGEHYGLQVQSVSRRDPQTIVNALSQGKPVIVSMDRGHFTKGGHFIVLRGITAETGKVEIYDPASSQRSKAWDLSIIMNESSKNDGINGCPFWIFSI